MILSHRILPNYKTCAEYFRNAGGMESGLILSLDEMGGLLGVNAFFKSDTDKIMKFFSDIAQGLEAESVKVIPIKENETAPKMEIHGKKFPDSITKFYLTFLTGPYSSITHQAKTTSRYFHSLNRELYSPEELCAFDSTFDKLNDSLEKLIRAKIKTEKNDESPKNFMYSIELHSPTNEYGTNIEKSVNSVLTSADYIQKAVNSVNRLQELRRAKINSIAEKLLLR